MEREALSRLYLVGMMGVGKTVIGKKLARARDCEFIDLDQRIEEATGVSISTIFEIEGERGFRDREKQMLAEISSMEHVVIATGGGAILHPCNRCRMTASGRVIYLHADPELLYKRTRYDRQRPLLQVSDPLLQIRRLVARRDPLYREVADLVIESGSGLGKMVARIQKALEI